MDERFLDSEWETEVDLTPLIDVVFMLLLFFILASTFSLPAMKVNLPRANSATLSTESPERLVLAIDAQGALWFRQELIRVDAIPALVSHAAEHPVELRVDRAAPFEAFVTVLDTLRQLGKSDVLITAMPSP